MYFLNTQGVTMTKDAYLKVTFFEYEPIATKRKSKKIHRDRIMPGEKHYCPFFG